MSPSPWLLLFNETPRADSVARGYYPWLREVDNPFFMTVPGIVHYTNWRIVATPVGAVPFTHDDLMFLAGPEVLEVGLASPEAQEFVAGWVESWGRFPENADAAVNFQAYLSEEIAAPPGEARQSETLVLVTYTPRADAQERGYDDWLRDVGSPSLNGRPGVVSHSSWRIVDPAFGTPDYTHFELIFAEGRAEASALLSDPDLRAFAGGWLEQWGQEPGADLADNLRLCVCERVATSDAAP